MDIKEKVTIELGYHLSRVVCGIYEGQEAVKDGIKKRAKRNIEDIFAILSEDPYVEGKEKGYTKAAELYEALFIEIDNMKTAIKIDLQNVSQNDDIDEIHHENIIQLERLLYKLRLIKNHRCKEISKQKKINLYILEEFTLFPKNFNALDFISSKKLREQKKGELHGFEEAKELYNKKLNKELKEIEVYVVNAMELGEDYLELFKEIIIEREKIISLDILEM